MLKLFLQFELQKIGKYFKTKTVAKSITAFLFMFVFLFIAFGIYYFFVSGFKYINIGAEEDIRLALTLFLYEVFLIILAGLIIFSVTVSSLFNLFKGDNNAWILSSPSYLSFPKFIFIRSLYASTLPLIILFLPVIAALFKVYSISILSLFFIFISVILFLFFLNSITLFSLLSLIFIYYRISQKSKKILFNFKGMILLLLALAGILFSFIWKTLGNIDLMSFFKASETTSLVSISNMASHFSFIPTHPFAMEIINWQIGEKRIALENFSLLFLFTAISFFLWLKISPLFYPLWQKFQEGNRLSILEKQQKTTKIYHFTGGIFMTLLKKEILISSRNFKDISWFIFLIFIWLLQIAANLILDHNIQKHGHDITEKIITLQIIQYNIAMYFISSFVLRFVFPSFSVERKTAWIIKSAPISFTKIFFGKYIVYIFFFVLIGIIMNYINSIFLHTPLTHLFYSMFLSIIVIIFIVTLGLSLGALFPNKESDNAEAITTSMPGLFFTALALIYGTISSFALYKVLQTGNSLIFSLFIGITIIITTTLLIQTPRIIKRRKG